MLKTVVLFNVFVETMILVFQDPLMNRNVKKKQHLFDSESFCNFINAVHILCLYVTFEF